MKLREAGQALITAGLIAAVTGCASIVDGGPRNVSIKSEPSEARLVVYDKKGAEVIAQQTPAIVSLKRGGPYSTVKYRIEVSKAGYKTANFEVKSTLNGWYVGNLIFGGLIGLLIVDPLTGAMWTLSPKTVNAVLEQHTAAEADVLREKGGLIVLLRKDVPEEYADKLVKLTD